MSGKYQLLYVVLLTAVVIGSIHLAQGDYNSSDDDTETQELPDVERMYDNNYDAEDEQHLGDDSEDEQHLEDDSGDSDDYLRLQEEEHSETNPLLISEAKKSKFESMVDRYIKSEAKRNELKKRHFESMHLTG